MGVLINAYTSVKLEKKMVGTLVPEISRTFGRNTFSIPLKEGIDLNKEIRQFFSDHSSVQRSIGRLSFKYHKSGIDIIELFYDHMLAACWGQYSEVSLDEFSNEAYAEITRDGYLFPYRIKNNFLRIITREFFSNYTSLNGTHYNIQKINKYSFARIRPLAEEALLELSEKYSEFKEDFSIFMEDFIQHLGYIKEGKVVSYYDEPVIIIQQARMFK
ncbi:MAG: acyl carrier protein phosphodiesterase [Cytophagaceae bacterium]|nr:acyl carrier protein phosphodiesterase [Cytophagaceae bacterium]